MGQMLNILIVEDNLIEARDIRQTVKDIGFNVVAIATRTSEAIECYDKFKPDVVLIDIELGQDKLGGIKVAHHVYKNASLPMMIFLTHVDRIQTIKDASRYLPLNYLMKPFTEIQLRATLISGMEKYQAWLPGSANSVINLGKIFIPESKGGYSSIAVSIREIVYLEADGSYCRIQMVNSSVFASFNLKKVLSVLPEKNFKRIHKSYAINIVFLEGLMRNPRRVKLLNCEKVIPIGETYFKSFYQGIKHLLLK
jgi:DNA-binding LytR/AlgR family response regulator